MKQPLGRRRHLPAGKGDAEQIAGFESTRSFNQGFLPVVIIDGIGAQGDETGAASQITQEGARGIIISAFQKDEAGVTIGRGDDLKSLLKALAIGRQDHGTIGREMIGALNAEAKAAVRAQPEQGANKEIRKLAT
jgi:hypothetical protein